MFSEEFLKDNHDNCLKLLDKFVEICKKYEIDYYLTEGSALGAVRHKGFIPWDIHIDIHLDIDNYNKLDMAMKKEDLGEYAWFSPSYRIIPIFMKKNQVSKSKDFDIVGSPNLDITIMGNAPDFFIFRWILMNIVFFNIKMFKLKNTGVKRPFPYNFFKIISSLFPDIFYRKVLYAVEHLVPSKTTKYKMALTPTFYGNSELIMNDWIGNEPTYADFEGRKVRIFNKYHEYLTNRYGNYMTPVVWEQKGEYNGCFYEHKEMKNE